MPLNFDAYARTGIVYPSAQTQFRGQLVYEGPKADTLHGALDI